MLGSYAVIVNPTLEWPPTGFRVYSDLGGLVLDLWSPNAPSR
jgi:hypothetical protein